MWAVWDRFFKEFPLVTLRCQDMGTLDDPDPASDEPVNDEIIEGLVHARHENPAMRKPEKLCTMLEYLDACNIAELKSMVENSLECPPAPRKSSLKMLAHLLKYIGRHKLHEKFPHMYGGGGYCWNLKAA